MYWHWQDQVVKTIDDAWIDAQFYRQLKKRISKLACELIYYKNPDLLTHSDATTNEQIITLLRDHAGVISPLLQEVFEALIESQVIDPVAIWLYEDDENEGGGEAE